MKELSIKQKAKAYDEALERARKLHKDAIYMDDNVHIKQYESIFPELKENDEKIKKALIDIVYDTIGDSFWVDYGVHKEEAVAWLEKQHNEQKPIINVPSREVILAIWDLGNEWKELTNGSISTEYGTQLNYIQKHWHESEYYLKVKQGENHADKVESKFHEGDWVVIKANGNEHVKQIVRIEYFTSGHPQYILSDGLWFGNGTEARLWTIEDVKPGNVLYSPCCKLLWIYKDDNSCYVGHNLNYSENCVVVNSPICIPSDVCPANRVQRSILLQKIEEAGYEWSDKDRKLISKKELKKVENVYEPDAFIEESYQQQADDLIDMVTEKSTWSEEDWNYIADLISYFNGSSLQHDTPDVISWLKSLKPQTTWKPSDEQVEALSGINVTGCISYAGQGQKLINLYNDLKKLMEE